VRSRSIARGNDRRTSWRDLVVSFGVVGLGTGSSKFSRRMILFFV
jgi:hypothetical protein